MKIITVLVVVLLLVTSLFGREYRAGDHELFIMPTAYTMPAGSFYFTDYELVFLNFTTALTNRTHAGFFTLFPITKDFLETFSLGLKHNYFRTNSFESAAWLAYTQQIEGFSIGNVISISGKKASFHAGISGMTALDQDEWEYLFMLGSKFDLGENTALIVEFENTNTSIENDFSGLISFGLRFIGKRITWDFAGIRPLAEDTGDFLLFPYIKATVFFSK